MGLICVALRAGINPAKAPDTINTIKAETALLKSTSG